MQASKSPLESYLSALSVPFTRRYAQKLYSEHPHKNNLYGLSAMLTHYRIENAGVRLSDKLQLRELEVPFVVHVGNEFALVDKMDASTIYYIWRSMRIQLSIDEFQKTWSGVALLAEPDEASREPDYEMHWVEEWKSRTFRGLLCVALFVSGVVGFISGELWKDPLSLVLLVPVLGGLFVCYLLLKKQLHVESGYADKLCSLFKKSDCNNILESDASKFLGLFSWSEVGFGYFTSVLLTFLFFPSLLVYSAWISMCIALHRVEHLVSTIGCKAVVSALPAGDGVAARSGRDNGVEGVGR